MSIEIFRVTLRDKWALRPVYQGTAQRVSYVIAPLIVRMAEKAIACTLSAILIMQRASKMSPPYGEKSGEDPAAGTADTPRGTMGYSAYCWMLFCIVLLVFGLLIVIWPGTYATRRRIARLGARLLFRAARMPLHARGLEHLPERTHILIANHASFLDALILTAALPASPGYAFVARQEYRSQALLWPLLRALGTIILHTHESHAAPDNLARMSTALDAGDNIIIFPEGGIVNLRGLGPFHSGAFVLAARQNVPIVMAGIHGARKALPLKCWRPLRTPVTVTIGDALHMNEFGGNAPENIARLARASVAILAGAEAAPAPSRKS